jgi:hypothetical protein
MRDILRTPNNFRSLSIRDLLDARDNYHYHLLNKPNVVGTAVGLYLIRKSDPEEPVTRQGQLRAQMVKQPYQPKPARTFANSEVRTYSWPCVLALVDKWEDEAEFAAGRRLEPQDMVPKTLYLPDGRMVPVCVVQVERAEPETIRMPDSRWPHSMFGPGMPILNEHQNALRRATVGCLVTDGHTTYALTSRHASGEPGETVETLSGGRRVPVGLADRKQQTRELFETLYPEFRSQRTFVNLDAGLIELDDVTDWTCRTYGLGVTGAMADLNAMNITTRLIEAPVVAFGAATGRLEGRIKALFYRYRSVGGYDYVSDLVIAPRDLDGVESAPHTQPGDSGAVWHLVISRETPEGLPSSDDEYDGELRPLAMEWGGQTFQDDQNTGRFTFALATTLTNVCRSLDVELVTEDRAGVNPYWGRFGHYSIAAIAIAALPLGDLRTFMEKNLDRVTFDHFDAKQMTEYLKHAKENGDYVPLADVPDEVWKKFKTNPGGRDTKSAGNGRTTGPEHPTHYADIDIPDANGVTLLQHSLVPANLTVGFWQQFYDGLGMTESRDRGLLPFRVWQFYTAMQAFAAAGDATSFLCAAGLLAHYVGDACQPLHGSQYADGYSDQPLTTTHHKRVTGEEYTTESHVGAGVHSAYETKMLDRFAAEIANGMQGAVTTIGGPLPATGADAAMEIVQLMNRAATAIPPTDLVDAFVTAGGKPVVATLQALWNDFGLQTIQVMTDGAETLARIWAGAWQGHAIAPTKLNAIPFDDVRTLYEDVSFIPSKDLDEISTELGAAIV